MSRFYCKSEDIAKDYIYLRDRSEIRHIKNSLRLGEKDKVVIFSDSGFEYEGVIANIAKDCISVKIEKAQRREINIPRICLACAIPKKAKIDYILAKATELGIAEFIPLKTERTIVDLKEREDARLVRWQKIAVSSAKQSGRVSMPKISRVLAFSQALSRAKDFDLALIPTLLGERKPLKQLLKEKDFKSAIVFIGPEGDFSPLEVAEALKEGCLAVSLGENTLKVDTAAIAVVSLLIL